jgi:hypothetical protein
MRKIAFIIIFGHWFLSASGVLAAAPMIPVSDPAGNTLTGELLSNTPTVNTGIFGNHETGDNFAAVTPQAKATGITLPIPKGLAAQSAKDKILLAWEPVVPATPVTIVYQVFRVEKETDLVTPAANQPWPAPLNREPIKDEFFLDSAQTCQYPPKPYTLYYYGVIAVDADGNSSPVSGLLKVINNCEFTAPVNVEAQAEDQKITLTWTKPFSLGEQGLAGYQVYRSMLAGEKGSPISTTLTTHEQFLDKGTPAAPLVNGLDYYYTIFAQDNLGVLSPPSAQLLAVPHIPSSSPVQVTGTGKSDDTIELRWAASKSGSYPVAGYNIYRGQSNDTMEGPINKKPIKTLDYLDSESNSTSKPLLGRTYIYTVRAVDERGFESNPSALVQATPRPPIEIPQSGILSTAIPGLPPESSLTISGRKKIDIGYTQVIPLNTSANGPTERSLASTSTLKKGFNLTQELQVKLQGKVGKKISVDVDYDDRTEEQRKISIVYAGEPDEIIQEAAFGDIKLDLPRTEFAGYNKDLFGAKLRVGLDRFRFMAIGAQTKGITVTEKFKGNASTRSTDITDLNFDAFKYYYITLDSNQVNHPDLPKNVYNISQNPHGLIPGTVKLYVTDNRNTGDTVRINRTEANGIIRTFAFNLQSPGIDYTVDFDRGIISFNTALTYSMTAAVAYWYVDADGNSRSVGYTPGGTFDFTPDNLVVPDDGKTRDTAHLIHDFNTSNGQSAYRLMIMNRYSLGYQNIVNPQTDPDFVIKVFKNSGEEIPITQPSNPAESENFYTIDPHFGLIRFKNLYPFQGTSASGLSPAPLSPETNTYDPTRLDAYNPLHNGRLGTSALNDGNLYRVHIEFRNQITTFQLAHWNVIKNSEVIKKDGSKLRRDSDYYMDYDTGFITFMNPEAISSSTEITVSYEYLPFGGKFQSNLFGARAEYDFIPSKLSVGSTYLFNASQTPQDIPDIRSTPTSLSLIDGDTKLSLNPDDFKTMLSPIFGDVKVPISVDASAEGAFSTYKINTYRRAGEDAVAMIDNMEGSDNVLSLPVDNNSWFPASAPVQFENADSLSTRHYITQSSPTDRLGRVPANSNDKKTQLVWDYTNLSSNSWDGFVYPISTAGSNLHDYRYLEISVYSDAGSSQQVTLHFDLGVISEDSNGNGKLNFEGDRVTLGPNDDIGITNYLENFDGNNQAIIRTGNPQEGVYSPICPNGYWGKENQRLNTEDLDRNDTLDTQQSYYEYDCALTPGWNYIKIPLAQYTRRLGETLPTDQTQSATFLSFVKHVRLWASGGSANSSNGYIQFESIQLTGNKWQPQVATSFKDGAGNTVTEPDPKKFNVTTVSQTTDPAYVPNTNFYNYDKNNASQELLNERSLSMQYNLNAQDQVNAGNTALAEAAYNITRLLTTGTGYSYTNYTNMKVDLFKKSSTQNGEVLFIRLGIDANNYYQYNISLDAIPVGTWYTVNIPLDGSNQNRIERFQTNVVPSLNQIRQVSMGILSSNNFGRDEVVWINNLRVTDGQDRLGKAFRITSNTKISDILTVSTDNRDVDSDFLSIDETPSGKQHTTSESINAAMTKLSYMPVRTSWSRTENFTEKQNRANPSYSNNFATPDVANETFTGEIGYTQVQGMDLSVKTSQARKITDYINQKYNVNNEERTSTVNPSLSYSLPAKLWIIPIGSNTFSGNLTYKDTHTLYDQEGTSRLARWDLYDRWMHSRDERYSYTGNYQPIDFITIAPNFSYNLTSERGNLSMYRFYAALNPKYDTTLQNYFSETYRQTRYERTAKLDVNLLHIPALTPTLSYAMTHNRDYVNDNFSIPNGTLSARTGFSPGDWVGWNWFPKFNVSRNYTISATFQHNPDENFAGYDTGQNNDPISKLDKNTMWWIDPMTFEDANTGSAFNSAYMNSKTYTDTASTSIYFWQDLSVSPQYSYSWSRKMNLNNFMTTKTTSLGSNLIWSRVPWLQDLIGLQSFNVDYQYKLNRNFDTNNLETTRQTSNTSNLTLPFRFGSDFSGSLTGGYGTDVNQNGQDLNVITLQKHYSGGGSLAYNLHMLQPLRLPNFWPFMGAQLKLEQALRIVNAFNAEMVRNTQQNITGQELDTDTYTNDTSFDYSLWKNVMGNLKVTNQWYYNRTLANKDYYALSLTLGLTATF